MCYTFKLLLLTLALPPHFSRSQSSDPPNTLTNVTCQPGFEWASNSAQQSPCAVAAAASFACSTSLSIPPRTLVPRLHYNTPGLNGQPVNICSCSWVAYNLWSACTLCQGDSDSITTFPHYSTNCASELGEDSIALTTSFPSNIVPLDNTSIPYYATVDPDQWQNSVFNITQAKGISSQGFRDIIFGTTSTLTSTHISSTSSSLTSSSTTESTAKPKNEVALIAGGLVGGFLLLFLIVAVIIFRVYQKRPSHNSYPGSILPTMQSTLELPTTSMDIIPYILPPSLGAARMKPSKQSTGPPQNQTHEQGELPQASPPAYSEIFNSARNVAEVIPPGLNQEPRQICFDSRK